MARDWVEPSGFAGQLRVLREAAGLSQKELAERVGCSLSVVQKLEQGLQEPTWPTVLALAKALGVSCEAFISPESAESAEPRKPGRPRKKAAAAGHADERGAAEKESHGRVSEKRGTGSRVTCEQRTAYHEAGHAVLSYHLGLGSESATIIPTDGALGSHRGLPPPAWVRNVDAAGLDGREKRAWGMDTVVVLFGGSEAEKSFDPNAPPDEIEAGLGLDYERIDALLVELAGDDEEEREVLSDYLAGRARRLLGRFWAGVEAVAKALLEAKTLDTVALSTILRAYYVPVCYDEIPAEAGQIGHLKPAEGPNSIKSTRKRRAVK